MAQASQDLEPSHQIEAERPGSLLQPLPRKERELRSRGHERDRKKAL